MVYFSASKQFRLFILRGINFFGLFIFWILESLVKKKENQIIIFGGKGPLFDNDKYFFKYALSQTDFHTIYFTQSKKTYAELKLVYGDKIRYYKSFRSLLTFLQTPTLVFSYAAGKNAFFPYYINIRKKTAVYLNHGVPFKRLGLQVPRYRKFNNHKLLQNYSKVITCSHVENTIVSSSFNLWVEDAWITGFPRNDYLVTGEKSPVLLEKHPYLGNKVILYAPTWREMKENTHFFPFTDFDSKLLNDFLVSQDAYLLVRAHNQELIKNNTGITEKEKQLSNIIYAGGDVFPDVYELLNYTDVLVTDYSSIFIDFMLTDKPMLFINTDLAEYTAVNGLFFDYNTFTPGKKVQTQDQFIEGLKTYLTKPAVDNELRIKLKDYFHKYSDNKASERVFEKLRAL